MKYFMFLLVTLTSFNLFAWGGRGHHSICASASFLVKEPGLKDYLKNKPQMMGHLCNMPDFYWKSLGPDVGKLGNSTHFIDIEVLGLKIKDIPSDYQKIVDTYTGTPNVFKKDDSKIFSIPQDFGSIWWRADQFLRKIANLEKEFTKATAPKNFKEEQDNELPYNKLAYQMVVDMGLMGHFVGDNAQPFHTSADYDGWEVGHGGIHSYYEDAIVGEFDGDLEARILAEARKMKNPSFLKPASAVDKMRALSAISFDEIKTVIKLDPIIKQSSVNKDKGMQIRTPAERKPAKEGYKRMNKMIVTQMARASLLLANMWDEAYVKAGKPPLASYKSYKYPFTVDFVAPDYFTESVKEKK